MHNDMYGGIYPYPRPNYILFVLVAGLLVCNWRIFKKAGRSGSACLIPYLNIYIESDLIFGSPVYFAAVLICQVLYIAAGQRGLSVLRFAALLVGAGGYIWRCFGMAKVFGKSRWFAVGLLLLPFIFIPILAFGKAGYIGMQRPEKMEITKNNK